MTKLFILGIVSIICLTRLDSNAQLVNKVIYGDEYFMKLSDNQIIYTFNEGLERGTWVAYYDSSLIDSAMLATIIDGKLNGPYKRWDQINKYVVESGNLIDGKRDGIFYFRLLNDDGVIYINIEVWDMGKFVEYVQQEW